MEEQYLKDFIDKFCMFTHRSQYEQESLLEVAQKSEEELIRVLQCVCGTRLSDAFKETAHGCWELMLIIRNLIEIAGERCSEDEWNTNREGLMECLRACECAMELAGKYAPNEQESIAEWVSKCRKMEREKRFRILV